jgi:hypothetical protein
MKIDLALSRHRRLGALLILSLLVHVLVIVSVARHLPAADVSTSVDQVTVRLRPPEHSGPALASAATPPPPAAAPAYAPDPGRPAPRAAPDPHSSSALAAPMPAAGATAATTTPDAAAQAPIQMPGRYRVRMPPPARLTYAVTRTAPNLPAAGAGEAHIDWANDGDSYRLAMSGVMGTLGSEGGSSDAGIAPRTASEQRSDGIRLQTRFDDQSRRILFSAGGSSAPASLGAQDRASVLMQLVGMGLAEPDQIKDVIEIVVAGAVDAQIARFQVLGQEQLETGIGPCSAWHLVRLAQPGEPRLELWLAPAYNWYPVQLRVTDPDGTTATQVLARLDAPGQAAPP